MHIKSDKAYVEGKSYYLNENDISIKDVIKWISIGILKYTKSKNWGQKVLIQHKGVQAVTIYRSGEEKMTEFSLVHFSNRGIHIVPKEVKRK